jgi:TfoX/Sxy family transcriptional regulator of competence genes
MDMSTKPETVSKFRSMLAGRPVVFRPMFGEYLAYYEDKLIGVLADDRLFLKTTSFGLQTIGEEHLAPPYPGAKPSLCVPEQLAEDPDWLGSAIEETAKLLPEPKPKKKK